jgi:voltage-gated potassium channel Kch
MFMWGLLALLSNIASMSENNSRTYGQGAQGEAAAPTKKKISLWTKFRYNFDNSLSRSGAFVGYVFAALILLSILMAIFKDFIFSTPLVNPAPEGSFIDKVWSAFSTILDKAKDATWGERLISIAYWIITTAVTATIIGFVATSVSGAVAKLKKGKSPVIDSGHTLILGWSNRVFPILKELAIANSNVRKPLVVVFSDQEREAMDDEIASRAGDLGKLRVVTRTGDVTNPGDLARANVGGAKSVIILDSDDKGDANVVSTVLAVKAVNSNPALKIVAEVDDRNTAEALTVATKGQVLTVRSHDVIARVTAQASRQPGLAAVVLDLLDFDGDEIYFAEVPALAGKTYADAILAFNTASVIGLVDEKGATHVNPKQTTKLTAGTKVIAIAEDDDKIIYSGVREDIAKKKITAAKKPTAKAEHLLFIGWSAMGRSVLNELAGFLPKGSTVHIVAESRYVDAAELASLSFGANLKVTHATVSGDIDELIAAASAKKYDEVIVLGYRNAISESEADAQTMLTMLQMNQLFEAKGNGVEPTRLVAEILDSRKVQLAQVAAADDLVVSDNLAALLIAQVAENPALSPVFDDIFDADGAAIHVVPVEHYAPLGKQIEFAELVAIARAHGESAIGYRVAADAAGDAASGVKLNPAKNSSFKPAAGDALVVVGNVN